MASGNKERECGGESFSKVIKFISLAVFCAFAFFFAEHYFELNDQANQLNDNLYITVFLEKGINPAAIGSQIEGGGLVKVSETVSAQDAYAKAVEKNPSLKDIAVPGAADAFPAYLLLKPVGVPTDEFLIKIHDSIASVSGVDDVVFSSSEYKKYMQTRNAIVLYQKIGLIFAVLISLLLIIKATALIYCDEENTRQLISDFALYLFAAIIGFGILWLVSIYIMYPLLAAKDPAAFLILPLTAALGIILKD